ncbi:hypothetical protein HG530_015014 [Fusarium avenaceum]|nr:hypothetical protein HG530_015014 [Fusarium avenaceum]
METIAVVSDESGLDNGTGLVNGNDVGVSSGRGCLVAGGTTEGENLSIEGIVHDGVTAHGVRVNSTVLSSSASSLGVSLSAPAGVVPVHGCAGTGLEDTALLPAKEPGVVISLVNTLLILGEHRADETLGQRSPGPRLGVVDFTVLATTGTTP